MERLNITDSTGTTQHADVSSLDGLFIRVKDGPILVNTPPKSGTGATNNAGSNEPAYESEFAELIRRGLNRVNADGNFVAPDGAVLTVADKSEPPPETFDHANDEGPARIMEWQLTHSLYIQQFYVDGNKVGYIGTDPGIRYRSTTVGGKPVLQHVPNESAPVAAVTVIPVGAGGNQTLAYDLKPGTQTKLSTRGMTDGLFTLSLRIGADLSATVASEIMTTQVPGFPNASRRMVIEQPAGKVVYDRVNNSVQAHFVVGNPNGWQKVTGAQFNLQPGLATVTFRAIDTPPEQLTDFRMDVIGH